MEHPRLAPGIAAFIDWDDAISGDAMDDLSLLGCFYDAPVIERALTGYVRVRPLPGTFAFGSVCCATCWSKP